MNRRSTLPLIAALFVGLVLAIAPILGAQTPGPKHADAGIVEPTITSTDHSMRVELPDGEAIDLEFANEPPILERKLVEGPRSFP